MALSSPGVRVLPVEVSHTMLLLNSAIDCTGRSCGGGEVESWVEPSVSTATVRDSLLLQGGGEREAHRREGVELDVDDAGRPEAAEAAGKVLVAQECAGVQAAQYRRSHQSHAYLPYRPAGLPPAERR